MQDFKKPELPPLKGAPSARRQYGYGAAAEPSNPRRLSLDGMQPTLQEAMNGVLRRQELQEAEEAAELAYHGQQLKPQTIRRYNPAREASLSDDDSESGSDVELNQQARGLDNSKYRQGLKSATTQLGMSFPAMSLVCEAGWC